jgi:hypothetical protein
MEVDQVFIRNKTCRSRLKMLARLALSDLDSDVRFVNSVFLVIIVLLVDIDFILFIIFALLLLVSERSAGFLLGLIFF